MSEHPNPCAPPLRSVNGASGNALIAPLGDSGAAAEPPMLSGRMVIPARGCQYPPALTATDLLEVDFDARAVNGDGLYLVEELGATGVAWRGCRRFQLKPGLHVDETGNGKWMPIDTLRAWCIRIVGRVEHVYRRVTAQARFRRVRSSS